MSAFDKVIGYEAIKEELIQICDMMHNRDIYEAMGAKLPQGILLYGNPGLGKTLMAQCFIEECNIKTFIVRRDRGGDFVDLITEVFTKAKENEPSIILLDDLDKFANEDDYHTNAQEYIAVQAGIDEMKGKNVLVIATANDIRQLPKSLKRSGRFDRKIEVQSPDENETVKIIEFYLASKNISKDVNVEDLVKMFRYSSCAELETFINEAAVLAAFKRKQAVEMSDLVEAVLKKEYNSPNDNVKATEDELRRVALHEAGHAVISEVLQEGSVGFVSIRPNANRFSSEGVMHNCQILSRRPYRILVSLGGKTAVELYYSETAASGCQSDLDRAITTIKDGISQNGICGNGLLKINCKGTYDTSDDYSSRVEAVVHAELERYVYIARDILLQNKEFLEKVTNELLIKRTLLFSDIQSIRNSSIIVSRTV